jgi:hypothetical protein
MPETLQLQAYEAVTVVFEFGRRLQVCHRFAAPFTGMMVQGNSPPFAS